MTQNDKDARTETNMDGTTWREANSETFGLNPTAGGMRIGMINVDRPDNRYSDREWNNDRDGLGWGLGSCSQCVFRSVCETVTVAWGCSRQLTWHCCGWNPAVNRGQRQLHPREKSTENKATECINLSRTAYSTGEGTAKENPVKWGIPGWENKRQFVSGSPFYSATPQTNYHTVQCVLTTCVWCCLPSNFTVTFKKKEKKQKKAFDCEWHELSQGRATEIKH